MLYCICAMLTALIIFGILYGIHIEKKEFNKGICPKCGKKLKWFDTDSQGGRGYCCNDCRYFTWVSYNCVDKEYKRINLESIIKWQTGVPKEDGEYLVTLKTLKGVIVNWLEFEEYG